METSARMRQRIEEFAAELREEFGAVAADARGCLLLPLEEWATAVGDQVARAAMEDQLAQASAEPETFKCPTCQRPASRRKERKRRIETRRGVIAVSEPECYCTRCRRAFFPSLARTGAGA